MKITEVEIFGEKSLRKKFSTLNNTDGLKEDEIFEQLQMTQIQN